jgi:hypothetical protein
MMAFLRAHGVDPGPTQRPLLAGALTGLAAAVPALIVFVSFGSFAAVADDILALPRMSTALLLVAAFTLAGALYGLTFRRAANDRHGGWLFGAAFGFILWMIAPIIVLPVMSGHVMAAGTAAMGFIASFLVWGTVIGGLFPHIHRPLYMSIYARLGEQRSFGPAAAALQRGKEPHKPAADQQ